MTDSEWGFADAEDARRYLGEVGRLWAIWTAGMLFLISNNGWVVVAGGAVVIAALLFFGRPLQARAARIVPEDTLVSAKSWSVLPGKGTKRDVVFKQLAYGRDPVREAVVIGDGSSLWEPARSAVVALTVAAFVLVLYQLMTGSGVQ
jgi:hypothetical protein